MRRDSILIGLLVVVLIGTGNVSAEDWDYDNLETIDTGDYLCLSSEDTYYGNEYKWTFELTLTAGDDFHFFIVDAETNDTMYEYTGTRYVNTLMLPSGHYRIGVENDNQSEDITVHIKYTSEDVADSITDGPGSVRDDDWSIPGFEALGVLVAITVLVLCRCRSES